MGDPTKRLSSVSRMVTFSNMRALLPLIVIAVLFVVFCLVDLRKAQVRYLPKWAWATICVISIPLGLWVFRRGELYAKRHGKLKRSG